MPFKYIQVPNTKDPNKSSTRAALGDPVSEAEFFAYMAILLSKPPADCEAAFNALLDTCVHFARDTRATSYLHGRLRMQPSSGGSFETGTTPHSPKDIGARMNLSLGPDTVAAFEDDLSIEKVGEEGVRAPQIDRVIDNRTGDTDKYTASDVLEVDGEHFEIDPTDTAQGVFLTPVASGSAVRITRYLSVTPTRIEVLLPAGLTGQQRLMVVCKYDTSPLRSSTYTSALSP
ncbi:MAG: hypothetical protein RL514_3675 [Verrucomicrobiota bacterium]|jgi:hypothetical protein